MPTLTNSLKNVDSSRVNHQIIIIFYNDGIIGHIKELKKKNCRKLSTAGGMVDSPLKPTKMAARWGTTPH